ncbi:MAG: ABC transporter ATP-binding protein [Actinobacteria bacterium BACL2 MAG-120820-bin50]|jgi:branched-chain amino acid transport system ATP-binding protein|uniref:ABC transporter ATP-binding protein n=3 Tax=ac1 cluster TaxID=1655545 RepID=A0A0R2QM44_9ACTN|nr:MAG: ABC transporter ATP-binding protein [Actinobacteria bacterium BACL2 MAG-120802-bin41]KRO33395.1 MAG: ABC transporter ATP-binding protein [Actinobacteria bacterium BACL2 MAG-121220-bin52]KRO51236.1 MAG: ABC transporter ATP-binding protein [Actinobacteria bacterium BACL2 MAG-120820-bin50]KRO73223.1 MAG: ABC transporter ATP-binding protein [Actinobacteria bacterium BACL2 MAG-120920-bin34]MDP4615243.1 ABC transporter ATP-binding protein [Candidatus Nanopelagicales bacterium]MDP4864334.1 AB
MSGLVVNRLSVSHGAIEALRAVSFSVEVGQLAAVIGSNGAGKTTLLRALSGLNNQTSGSAQWNEREILGARPDALVRRGISHVSEGKSVIAELSVKENLILGGIWRSNKSDTSAAIAEVVELFPVLGQRMSQSADSLSGGERQMLAIGRALVSRPKLLLLDEPSLGLAPLVIEQIFATIDQLRRKLGLTVVLVEQNAMSALEIADIGIIINLGEVVASGRASELIDDPALRAAYLGY